MDKESTVLIYGTNLAGYRVAYALAKMGYKTVMLNRGSYVDEYRNQALAQLPLDFCWACGHMPQRLFIGLGAMQVFYNADLLEVSGEPGSFTVKIKKKDHYVNNFACTECEACVRACPVEVQENGGEKRKAIYVLPEIAWENIFIIDEEHCTKCGECEKVCPTGCLKLERQEETLEMDVGAIVLAPEFDDPGLEDLGRFGYGKLPNVVKSADLARKSLLTNFVKNSMERPSDGKLPGKVAIVVTPHYNRDVEYENYNTSISAVYRACRIKELMPDTEVTVFLREFRGFGKGHYQWFEKALDMGVQVVRASRLSVEESSGDNVGLSYTVGESESVLESELLILVTGQKPPSLMDKLSKLTGVEADEHGFCRVLPFTCGRTTKDGIFAVGEFTGPKGNPEAVWEGYGTATEVLDCLGGKNFAPAAPPQLRDVSGEPPKVGVFICSCFGEFSNFMDLEALREKVEGLPGVSHAEIIKGCCTPPTIQETAHQIKESGVNRVVLAVCTPLQKLLKYRRTVMMAGLNPLLTEFLRLREDVIRVHQDRDMMLEKALTLIASGVEKVKKAQAAPPPTETFNSAVLVIGGGVAGMEAALTVASRGFPVALVEEDDQLGGQAFELVKDLEGNDLAAYAEALVERVENDSSIALYKNARIKDMWGHAGHFYAEIESSGEDYLVQAGIVIPALGAKPFNPEGSFLYGKDERVITQRELEKLINKGDEVKGPVAMIQCVGSRNKVHPYCSRVCCSQALKNALDLVDKGIEVTILYRDLNTYGFKEDYYQVALEKGIRFIRFAIDKYPEVEAGQDGIKVQVHDVERDVREVLDVSTLILSVGMVPDRESYEKISGWLGYRLDSQGFFDTETSMCPYEEAIKRLMKPWELSSNAVFPVGLAHSPRAFTEALLTAKDAAGKSLTLLGKPQLPPPNAMYVSAVRESKCVGCGICVEVCPYYAREIDEEKGVVRVIPYLCDSCGACLVGCPSEAAYLKDARGEQMIPSIDALVTLGGS